MRLEFPIEVGWLWTFSIALMLRFVRGTCEWSSAGGGVVTASPRPWWDVDLERVYSQIVRELLLICPRTEGCE